VPSCIISLWQNCWLRQCFYQLSTFILRQQGC
jgi:hypothetical protein